MLIGVTHGTCVESDDVPGRRARCGRARRRAPPGPSPDVGRIIHSRGLLRDDHMQCQWTRVHGSCSYSYYNCTASRQQDSRMWNDRDAMVCCSVGSVALRPEYPVQYITQSWSTTLYPTSATAMCRKRAYPGTFKIGSPKRKAGYDGLKGEPKPDPRLPREKVQVAPHQAALFKLAHQHDSDDAPFPSARRDPLPQHLPAALRWLLR